MPNINWTSFALGIVAALVAQYLLKMRSKSAA